jgi:ABC-type multidrug transport system permease subunit
MREPTPHVITGEPALVWAALSRANEEGRLVRVERGRRLPGGRVQLVAQLHSVPTRSRWELVRPWLVRVAKLAAVLAVVAAVGGLVWLLVLAVLEVIALVTAVVAWVQANLALLIVGAVALLVLFLAAMASGSRCSGLHCGGCRR